jgi:hypothetical protein
VVQEAQCSICIRNVAERPRAAFSAVTRLKLAQKCQQIWRFVHKCPMHVQLLA